MGELVQSHQGRITILQSFSVLLYIVITCKDGQSSIRSQLRISFKYHPGTGVGAWRFLHQCLIWWISQNFLQDHHCHLWLLHLKSGASYILYQQKNIFASMRIYIYKYANTFMIFIMVNKTLKYWEPFPFLLSGRRADPASTTCPVWPRECKKSHLSFLLENLCFTTLFRHIVTSQYY